MDIQLPPEGVTLTTDRLLLRPLRDEDAPTLAELANDRRIAEGTLVMPFPYTRLHAEHFIQHEREGRTKGVFFACAIERRADSQLIGMIGLTLQADHCRAEMGYWLGVPYWNQGYVTEAGRAMLDYGFGVLGLNRVFASHYTSNPASGRVMQKLGMRQEGVLRQHLVRFDTPRDSVVYGLLHSEWAAR